MRELSFVYFVVKLNHEEHKECTKDTKENNHRRIQMAHKYRHKNLVITGAILLCALLLLPSLRLFPVGAQITPVTDVNRDVHDTRIVSFFEALKRGNSASAFEGLLSGSPLGAPEASMQATELRRRVEGLQPEFGDIITQERLDSKPIGANITLVRYVLMYEHYPVVWTFAFYRKPTSTTGMAASPATNPWVLVELHFDTDLKSLL